jgi:hypothetical protein
VEAATAAFSSSVTQDKKVLPLRPQPPELLLAPQGQRRGKSSVDRTQVEAQMARAAAAVKEERERVSRDLPIQTELLSLSGEDATDRKSATAPRDGQAKHH